MTFNEIREQNRADVRNPNRNTAKPTSPGLYLTLFHGRDDPNQDMDDWGYDGPAIGPLEYVHTTYSSDIKFSFLTQEDHDRFFIREVSSWHEASNRITFRSENDLQTCEDMIEYDGKYYGDWTVQYVEGEYV